MIATLSCCLLTTPRCVSGRLHRPTEGAGEGTNGGLEGEDREEVGKEVSIFKDLKAIEVSTVIVITRVVSYLARSDTPNIT